MAGLATWRRAVGPVRGAVPWTGGARGGGQSPPWRRGPGPWWTGRAGQQAAVHGGPRAGRREAAGRRGAARWRHCRRSGGSPWRRYAARGGARRARARCGRRGKRCARQQRLGEAGVRCSRGGGDGGLRRAWTRGRRGRGSVLRPSTCSSRGGETRACLTSAREVAEREADDGNGARRLRRRCCELQRRLCGSELRLGFRGGRGRMRRPLNRRGRTGDPRSARGTEVGAGRCAESVSAGGWG